VGEAMRRREFITVIVVTAALRPLVAHAQYLVNPVIGSLYAVSAAEWEPYVAGFRSGLTEGGFVEGRNVSIEYRWAEGHLERLAWCLNQPHLTSYYVPPA
jgi:putative ABC transport system substrate-binding protein